MWLFTVCDPGGQISHILSSRLAGDLGTGDWTLKSALFVAHKGSKTPDEAAAGSPSTGPAPAHLRWMTPGETLS